MSSPPLGGIKQGGHSLARMSWKVDIPRTCQLCNPGFWCPDECFCLACVLTWVPGPGTAEQRDIWPHPGHLVASKQMINGLALTAAQESALTPTVMGSDTLWASGDKR